MTRKNGSCPLVENHAEVLAAILFPQLKIAPVKKAGEPKGLFEGFHRMFFRKEVVPWTDLGHEFKGNGFIIEIERPKHVLNHADNLIREKNGLK